MEVGGATVFAGATWLKRLFSVNDRRRESRQQLPGLVAHYWDGASPRPRDVMNISADGSFVQTEDRGYPGTVFRVTLQSRASETGDDPAKPGGLETLVVLAEIVRTGVEGMGLRFLFPGECDPQWQSRFPDCLTDRRTLARFLEKARRKSNTMTFSMD